MLGRAGAILAVAALSLGASAAAGGGGLWDSRVPTLIARDGANTPQGRVSDGACELEGADRATTSSRRCIGCHDGSAGAAIELNGRTHGSGSHPVEVVYDAVVARQPNRYHPAATLPREIPLVNGKVTCTSCHDGASPEPKHVAIPQRLCQSCHDL